MNQYTIRSLTHHLHDDAYIIKIQAFYGENPPLRPYNESIADYLNSNTYQANRNGTRFLEFRRRPYIRANVFIPRAYAGGDLDTILRWEQIWKNVLLMTQTDDDCFSKTHHACRGFGRYPKVSWNIIHHIMRKYYAGQGDGSRTLIEALRGACSSGHRELIQYIVEIIKKDEKPEKIPDLLCSEGISHAGWCRDPKVAMANIKYLMEQGASQIAQTHDVLSQCVVLCEHPEVINFMLAQGATEKRKSLSMALIKPNLSIFQIILEHLESHSPSYEPKQMLITLAQSLPPLCSRPAQQWNQECESILKLIYQKMEHYQVTPMPNAVTHGIQRAFGDACLRGNTLLAQRLFKDHHILQSTDVLLDVFVNTCVNDRNLDLIMWLHPQITSVLTLRRYFNGFKRAGRCGSIQILKYLLPNVLTRNSRHIKMLLFDILLSACQGGHLKILEYVLPIYCDRYRAQLIKINTRDHVRNNLIPAARKCQNLEVVSYLEEFDYQLKRTLCEMCGIIISDDPDEDLAYDIIALKDGQYSLACSKCIIAWLDL